MLTGFGKFCRKLRIDNDEKMKDMAPKLGVAPSYLSAVEKGRRKVPIEWAKKIQDNYVLTEQQIRELTNLVIIDSLTKREKMALNEAVTAICQDNSSDYINGLWGVVTAIVGESMIENEGFNIIELANLLNRTGVK